VCKNQKISLHFSRASSPHPSAAKRKKKWKGNFWFCFAVILLGFDRAQMSNIEAGKGNPTLATIEKIAQALGVASDELLK
jgi:hypothetical protein